MGELTDKMQKTLDECFDARLRELNNSKNTLTLNFVKVPKELNDEIESLISIKKLHNQERGLFRH